MAADFRVGARQTQQSNSFFHVRCQPDHVRIGEELRHDDAGSFACRLKRCNGRDRISSENVTDGGLRQTALL